MNKAHLVTRPFTIDLSKAVRWVVIATSIVFALGVFREVFVHAAGTGTILQELRPFGLDSELAISAFYSSIVMLAASGVVLVIAWAERETEQPDQWRWLLLAVIFAAMAVDKSASLHETLMSPIRETFGLSGLFFYAWVVPGGIGVALIGLYYLPFLFRLKRSSALLIGLAGAIYVSGALGMELLGGAIDSAGEKSSPLFSLVMVIEEGCELWGLTLLFFALVRHLGMITARVPAVILARPRAGPKNYARSDEPIKEDINDRLTDDGYLDASDIEVEVSNREVTLSGKVMSLEAKRRAEDIADSVSGVTNVQNNLRVSAELGSASESAMGSGKSVTGARGTIAGSAQRKQQG